MRSIAVEGREESAGVTVEAAVDEEGEETSKGTYSRTLRKANIVERPTQQKEKENNKKTKENRKHREMVRNGFAIYGQVSCVRVCVFVYCKYLLVVL